MSFDLTLMTDSASVPAGRSADETTMKSHTNSYLQQLRRWFSFHQFSLSISARVFWVFNMTSSKKKTGEEMRGEQRREREKNERRMTWRLPFSLHLLYHSTVLTASLLSLPLSPPFSPTLCTVLDNPCIFNIAASSKLWTYSLAFRVLMKAHRVLAPSLFPYTSSPLPSSNPTPPCTIYNTPLPPTCSITEGQTNKLKERSVWERQQNPTGFYFLSSSATTSITSTKCCSIHVSSSSHFSLSPCCSSAGKEEEFPVVLKVCCSFLLLPSFSVFVSLSL